MYRNLNKERKRELKQLARYNIKPMFKDTDSKELIDLSMKYYYSKK